MPFATSRTAAAFSALMLAAAFLFGTQLLPGVSRAWAASLDYCISCANPAETYVCRITTPQGSAQGQQFVCIMNIARDYRHDSCTVSSRSKACEGVLVQYELAAMPTAPGADRPNDHAPAAQPSQIVPQPQKTVKKKVPDTLVEFTKQAGKDTGEAFKKTGKAIKNTGKSIGDFTGKVGNNLKDATTTTLKCLTSLFSDCSTGN